MIRAIALCCVLALLVAPRPLRAEQGPADLVEEARGHLQGESDWPQAIELYERALSIDPAHVDARRGLAQVLAWRRDYSESLQHYSVLIEAGPGHADLIVEAAEVRSWAGRYAEAERALEALLEREPGHAGALRALARSQNWRGDKIAAERSYRRALRAQPDAEVEKEWRELRLGHGETLGARASFYADNGNFSFRELHAEASGWLDLQNRWLARAGIVHSAHDQDGVDARIRNLFDSDQAPELEVELRHLLSPSATVIARTGLRAWRRAGTRPEAKLGVEVQSDHGWSWSTALEHRDLVDLVQSFEALQKDLTLTGLQWTGYHSLPARTGFFGKLGVGRASDGNLRLQAIGSFDWQPFDAHELSLGLGASALRYSDEELAYYSPRLDAGASVLASYVHLFPANVRAEVRASFGAGRADTRDAGASSGGVGGAEGRLRWEARGWSVDLFAAWFSARGGEGFTSREVALRVEHSF